MMLINIKTNGYKSIRGEIDLYTTRSSQYRNNKIHSRYDLINHICIFGNENKNNILDLIRDLKNYIINKDITLLNNLYDELSVYLNINELLYHITIDVRDKLSIKICLNITDLDENILQSFNHLDNDELVKVISNIDLKYNLRSGTMSIEHLTNQYKNTNKQLIFTTSRAKLMNKLPLDSIYILNCNYNNKFDLYSLIEFNDITNYNNINKAYLHGRFGGIQD